MSQKRWVHICSNSSTQKANADLQVPEQPGLQSKILYQRARTKSRAGWGGRKGEMLRGKREEEKGGEKEERRWEGEKK